MKKKKAMQLVKVLRSGTYKQGRHALVDNNDCFCVLGVACNESTTDLKWVKGSGMTSLWSIGREFYQVPQKIQNEYGFYSRYGKRRDGKCIQIGGQCYDTLTAANDDGVSFKDLADYIEKNYKVL